MQTAWQTQDQTVPGGAAYTHYHVAVVPQAGGDPVAEQFVPYGSATTATFSDPPPGDYVAAVRLTNADASSVGPGAVSAAFTVPEADPTLAVPVSVTVTLGAPGP